MRVECSHMFRALWECTDAFWVSQPSAIQRASLKLVQLNLARALGFTVPPFMVTNEVENARNFMTSCRDGAIVKVATPYTGDSDQSTIQILDADSGAMTPLTGRAKNVNYLRSGDADGFFELLFERLKTLA